MSEQTLTKQADEKFCSSCGAIIKIIAEICPKCGVRNARPTASKNKTTVLLLCLFLGCFGVHRFYVGKTGSGIAQLFTLGGIGIWALIDLVMIITDKFTDANGNTL
ncbi:MAG: NINE protein [Fibromonadaceae bacterium]|nr:NINE protein [Fibromonadaceae bacterium]